MIAQDLINPLIPALYTDDDIAKATALLDDLIVAQLPVVHGSAFLGFVTNDMLFDDLFGHTTVGQYQLRAKDCSVRHDQHFYEVAKVLSDCDQSMVAVVDDDDFVGVIDTNTMLLAFSQTTAVQSLGGVVELSIKQIDYSLTEITRLVEADGVKVLGCFLRNDPTDLSKIKLTLKLDQKNVTRTVATLERFNYHVQALFQEELIDSHEKERLNALLKYLDM